MKYLIISLVALLPSCIKLQENIKDTPLNRPQIDIQIPLPEWDTIPQNDNNLLTPL